MDIREAYCGVCDCDRLHHQADVGSENYKCMSCGTIRLSQEIQLVNVVVGLTSEGKRK